MKVVCIMCGLRQLAGAGTNWKFLLSPRPIKLRVNLAPLIIAAGASPFKKNFFSKLFAQLGGRGIITSSGLLLFSSAQKKSKKILSRSSWKDRNIVEGELAPHADLIHAMHIQLFRLQQKHTSNHFLSNSVLPAFKMDPGPQKVCPGQCIWEELLVFEVPATVNNRFDIQTRTMLFFAASLFGKKSSK